MVIVHAHRQQSHKDAQAWPKVTQEELANMIRVTRQRVDVVLNGSENQVVIHCADGLRAESFSGKQHPHGKLKLCIAGF